MKVYIRPKYSESIQGRNQKQVVGGKVVGTTKAPNAMFVFQLQDKGDGQLAIDLKRKVLNKYKGQELPKQWEYLKNEDKITRQEELEIKYELEPGELHTRSFGRLDKDSNSRKRSVLQSLLKFFNDGITILDLDNLTDELIYEGILESPYFASSYEEAMHSHKCRFYITHEEEEEERKASRVRPIMDATAKLSEIRSKYSADKLYEIGIVLKMFSGNKISQDAIDTKFFEWINEKSKIQGYDQTSRISRFVELYDMVTSKKASDKNNFKDMFFLQELINYNVVSDYQDKYIWTNKRNTNLEIIGKNKAEVLRFIANPENKEYVTELEEELKTRK